MKSFFLSLLFCVLIFKTSAQTFHDEVKDVFNFVPHKLTKEEQQKIFPRLDTFFNKVISNKTQYLEPLREELKRNDNSPYFYYDGGLLLLEISKTPEDFQLVADALVKTDLRDIPPKMYLMHILRLSVSNANVIDAALHIFDDPSFQVFIEQHVLLLNQGECLKFILPRYNSTLYASKLIPIYAKAESDKVKRTILELLYYSRSCEADKFIEQVSANSNESEELRNLSSKILSMNSKKRKIDSGSYQENREKIKASLVRISDEALYELDELTKKLSSSYKCE